MLVSTNCKYCQDTYGMSVVIFADGQMCPTFPVVFTLKKRNAFSLNNLNFSQNSVSLQRMKHLL